LTGIVRYPRTSPANHSPSGAWFHAVGRQVQEGGRVRQQQEAWGAEGMVDDGFSTTAACLRTLPIVCLPGKGSVGTIIVSYGCGQLCLLVRMHRLRWLGHVVAHQHMQ
jgi:hypothetical protein